MTRGLLFVLIDFGFLILAAVCAYLERGTFSGWCWLIATVAWIFLLVNAIFFSKHD